MPDPLPVSAVPVTAHFTADMCELAVAAFGEDGAWLLLSQVWYGWRAYYDLARAVRDGEHPIHDVDHRPTPIGPEYQIVVDLQVQGFLYASAEQFATLVRAMQFHEDGTTRFFDEYVGAPTNLATLISDLSGFSRDDFAALVGDPASVSQHAGTAASTLLDPANVVTTDVGGLHVPKAVIDAAARQGVIEEAEALLDLAVENVKQLRQFVDPPEPIPGAERQPQALRAVDNSFRHGLRLLFHEACPTTREFRVGGMVEPPEAPSVDLYLPGRGKAAADAINFATVSCTEDRTVDHLEALRQLSIRVGQLARAFLGYQTSGALLHLLAATKLTLPEVATQPLDKASEERADSPA